MIELNNIYKESCLETMKKIPDNGVDLIVTSPPYNMNLRIRNGKHCSRQIIKEISTKYEDFDDNLPMEEYYEFHKSVINEMLRISPIIFYNIQFLTGNKQAFFKLMGEFHDKIKDIVIWDKEAAQPAMKAGVFNSQFEVIIIFDNNNAISRMFKKYNFDRGTLSNLWKIKRGKKIDKSHGAVFPEELVSKILLNFSNENDIIYDPFAGTGTTLKVAKDNNRRYIGSEISEKYISIINQRLCQ
jgi:site-specific DNA-methyltransferase (adenine-specific)/modification methylase